jgi:uncharacterized protein (DUF433 family)
MEHPTEHPHIERVDGVVGGEPVIKGTRVSVRAIVEYSRMMPLEEIRRAIPHITLAQIYDAMSYYHDHAEEIERYIKENQIPPELIHPLVRDL